LERAVNSIETHEAKTHLSKLLELVGKGETITITRHGSPVALLAPAEKTAEMSAAEAVAELKKCERTANSAGPTLEKHNRGRKAALSAARLIIRQRLDSKR